MRLIGLITTAALAALAVSVTVELVRALPDIRRYARMRAM
ncbi:DUF6893 family small protein [Paractinoplanes atraurantiacus]|uniref:Uncharacterized protein n=1 Tax=Paractinoplanes atraurantiacus TaxID=1036182 RepID=A0A285J4M4_9ACTN|nr:hypothetical protein SAMN05421748_115160 [Actinoplanes atraurantiacus]